VDMAGGDSLDTGVSRVSAPVEILVLGSDGNLFVRSQVTDADDLADGIKELQRRRDAITQPNPSGAPAASGGFSGGSLESFDSGSKASKQLKSRPGTSNK